MRYLLDVNVLVAWGRDDHPHNLRVRKWVGSVLKTKAAKLHTCPITEIGFIRVSLQKTVPRIEIQDAANTLEKSSPIIKIRIVKLFPDSAKFQGVAISEPVSDKIVGVVGIFRFRNIRE